MFLRILFLWIITQLVAAQVQAGKVEFDGSMGGGGAVSGPNYEIGSDLGRLVGKNLFHSFSAFSIDAGEVAHFSKSLGHNNIEFTNVISRVTGDQLSIIDGTLSSSIDNADFYLVNSSGIVFGATARIDVPAAFHASTASEIRFSDGQRFSTVNGDGSSLSLATPEALGFYGKRGDIEWHASESFGQGDLSLSAKDIELSGSILNSNQSIFIAATGDSSLDLSLESGSVTGNANGRFFSEDFQNIQVIEANSTGSKDGGGIFFHAGDIDLQTTSVQSRALGSGDAASIHISASNLSMYGDGSKYNSGLFTSSWALDLPDGGDGGDITLDINDTLYINDKTYIQSNVVSLVDIGLVGNGGDGGTITINASDLIINSESSPNASTIQSYTFDGTTGNAGDIFINVNNDFIMNADARISTDPHGDGRGGNIEVLTGRLIIDDFSDIHSDAYGIGNGGDVSIDTDYLSITKRSSITALTRGDGHAGNIVINANLLAMDVEDYVEDNGSFLSTESLWEATGNGGTLTINATDMYLANKARIVAKSWAPQRKKGWMSTPAEGDAGQIILRIERDLRMIDSSVISAATGTHGNGGFIDIDVGGDFYLSDAASVKTITGDADFDNVDLDLNPLDSSGAGGDIFVDVAGDFSIIGGSITSSSFAVGDAGNIEVNVIGEFNVSNGGEISSVSNYSANAGNIDLKSSFMSIRGDETRIYSSSLSPEFSANAGELRLSGNQFYLSDNAVVEATSSLGRGGDITLKFEDLIDIRNAVIRTSVYGGSDGGGNIAIDPIVIFFSNATIQANATVGSGGSINIVGDYIFFDIDNPSMIEASSSSGVDGRVNTDAVGGTFVADMAMLKADYLEAGEILENSCRARKQGLSNSLVNNSGIKSFVNPTAIVPVFYRDSKNDQDEQISQLLTMSVNCS